ncbi:hypothetical protein BZG36_02985 [Bifiguratus adelaidae]|uniref:SEC7 domain-containing protein n=1 Tax=Bifiguratus adelaidae TaxID=1938954 RepID=A0A261XYB3_9FUNG|nr:hypothetical protein BZG36_02985 [Bifiguratus adelaidae]
MLSTASSGRKSRVQSRDRDDESTVSATTDSSRQRQSKKDEASNAIRKKLAQELNRKRAGPAPTTYSGPGRRQRYAAGTVAALKPLPALTVKENLLIIEAAQLMAAKRTDSVLVVNEDEHLSGIFTAKDLAYRVVAEGLDSRTTTVSAIMTKGPMCVTSDTSATDALNLMVSKGFRHLPVCNEDGDIFGLLDITKCFIEALNKMERAFGSSRKLYDALEGVEKEWASNSGGPAQLVQYMEMLRDRMSCPDLTSVMDRSPPVEVGPKTTVREIARLMKEHHTTAVLVMEKHSRHAPVNPNAHPIAGIFTSKDVVLRVIAAGLNPDNCSVVRVMTPHPDTAKPDLSIVDALRKMHNGHYLNLPVVDEYKQIVGIVDVLKLTYATLEQVNSIQGSDSEGGGPMWSKFWQSFGGAENDAESTHSDSQAHTYPPQSPPRTRSDMSGANMPNFGEVTPNESVSVAGALNDDALSAVSGADRFDENTFAYKFKSASGKVHRFAAAAKDYAAFRAIVLSKCRAEHDQTHGASEDDAWLQISYQDEDKDEVIMTSDADLQDAVSLARKQGLDRVIVQVLDTTAPIQHPVEALRQENANTSGPVTLQGHDTPNANKKKDAFPIPQDMLLPASIAFLGVVIVGVFIVSHMPKIELEPTSPFLFASSPSPAQHVSKLSADEREALVSTLSERVSQDPKALATLAQQLSRRPQDSQDVKHVTVQPLPGFCFKTRITKAPEQPVQDFGELPVKSGMTVYINVCQANACPPPPALGEDEIQKALEAKPSAYQVPLSLGSIRWVGGTKADPVPAFDAMVHTSICERATKDMDYGLYIVELAIEHVEEALSATLSREFDMIAAKSKGEIPTRTLSIPKSMLIHDLSPSPAPSKPSDTLPHYEMKTQGDRTEIAIFTPLLSSLQNTTLDHTAHSLVLHASPYHCQIPITRSASSLSAAYSQQQRSHVFVVNALDKIAQTRDARRNKALKGAIDKALGVIKNGEVPERDQSRATLIYDALELSIQTNSPTLVVTALDLLGKLLSYNYLFDTANISEVAKAAPEREQGYEVARPRDDPQRMLDAVVELICNCFVGDGTDEKVQLQIVKALQAAVLGTQFPLHQAALLRAVRTTYNVFLLSRDPSNQTIAQFTLAQMIHHTFGRVKADSSKISTSQTSQSTSTKSSVNYNSPPTSSSDHVPTGPTTPTPDQAGESTSSLGDRIVKELQTAKEGKHPETDTSKTAEEFIEVTNSVFQADVADTKDAPSKTPASENTTPESSDAANAPKETDSSEPEESDEKAESDPSTTPTPTRSVQVEKAQDAHSADGEVDPAPTLSPAPSGRPKGHARMPSEGENDEPLTLQDIESKTTFDNAVATSDNDTQADLFIKDAYLVFRALCKLSMKPISNEGSSDLRSYSMRSKLLSLHLILTILTSHLVVFTSPHVTLTFVAPVGGKAQNDADQPQVVRLTFIQAIKQNLCLSLSRNAVSVVPQVFETSSEIFWKCVLGLRMYMKKEIEVFFNEIYLPILEMRNASAQQKHSLLKVIQHMCNDPQTMVEIYLNYDCDGTAIDNIYERLVNVLSKISTTYAMNPGIREDGSPSQQPTQNSVAAEHAKQVNLPPALTTTSLVSNDKHTKEHTAPNELAIKYKSLECLVSVLRSLVAWYNKDAVRVSTNGDIEDADHVPRDIDENVANTDKNQLTQHANGSSSRLSASSSTVSVVTPAQDARAAATDDPEQFEYFKHRKQLLQSGIRKFNWKPKKGVQMLIEDGFIPSNKPADIANFLLHTEGLSKAMIGEYLGEGEEENIAIMHAFVDTMDFTDKEFVEALREFLQSFRLPGEAQKIDRFMLKFAERYLNGNPSTFANADTAYVLAYSVIMLNTDAHNPQVRNRMSKEEFLRNNRGIDDGKDLPEDFLVSIYNEIQVNEIKMKGEAEASVMVSGGNIGTMNMSGLQNALASVGVARDTRKEAYQAATEEMATKTEALFKNMLEGRSGGAAAPTITFYSASHVEHVRPMFEVAWMSFLTGLSSPLQESDDMDTVALCLEGFKYAIRIVCLFHFVQSEDMELQRDAFVSTLTKFTNLTNLGEMKPKNVEAIKAMLDIASTDGNYLKGSWKDILTSVSQLERFQLISSGVDQGVVPDLLNARKQTLPPPKSSMESSRRSSSSTAMSRKLNRQHTNPVVPEDVALASNSTSVILAVDKFFTSTVHLNGEAIVDFVRAMCEVSWEEIVSSAMADQPRMYSLQKLVEISYYNMNRIRLEWSNVWAILGEHFDQVGCQSNFNVSFFAIDSLRQLSMKFLEKEELPHFKFQKDFLHPFEYILANNSDVAIKDMVLRCLTQMIQARAHHIRSGWKTLFAVFSRGARESHESIVVMTFEIVRSLCNEHFQDIVVNGAFPDLITCLSEFSKNRRYQKISLQALDIIKVGIPKMVKFIDSGVPVASEGKAPQTADESAVKFWFAILFGLKEVIMKGDDLEVRTRALGYLFETLKDNGATFAQEFWVTILQQIIYPIFADLRPDSEHRRGMSQEDFSVWLSTTLIQAIRSVVDLYSYYFDLLKDTMDNLLELLSVCIIQDNDVLAKIGCQCLQQYIETNVDKLDGDGWEKITRSLEELFDKTKAAGLFENEAIVGHYRQEVALKQSNASEPNGRQSSEMSIRDGEIGNGNALASPPVVTESDQKRFQSIIVQCVLQLFLIQTVHDLLNKQKVYASIPARHLMDILACLEKSFHFAKRFNNDSELRMALFKYGYMKQLPNLLKQETSAGACYVMILMKMYSNTEDIEDRRSHKKEIESVLIPLCSEIFELYASLDVATKPKNISAWTPVVVSILKGLSQFQSQDYREYLPQFYLSAITLLKQENLLPEIRLALYDLLVPVINDITYIQHWTLPSIPFWCLTMIQSVLIFNNHGKARLTKFYQQVDIATQQALIQEIFSLVSKRPDTACNFLEGSQLLGGKDTRVIYRHYATLYFVFVVDESESELGILDLIQVFVESLDRCFENVCELDLIFHFEEVHHTLSELIQGGMVLETNMTEIVAAIAELNKLKKKTGALSTGSISLKPTEALRRNF